ncbi:MAG: hypothetical protein M9894_20565 [Planctomycetes bacterium]|nr:hypothetical protein [Planctomycetota bacterium]
MSWADWALWGFVATVVLTITMAGAQGLGLTRMSVPYLLGTMITTERDRAHLVGMGAHLVNGWLFSLIYVAAFHAWGASGWWRGAAIGAVHAAFVLTAVMTLLPAMHPRMAREEEAPDRAPTLEPAGFLALNYGARTPAFVLLAHLLFGAVLGAFYRVG